MEKMEQVHDVDIYPIYGIEYTPWWHKTWFLLVVACAIGISVGVVFYYFYKKRKTRALSFYEQALSQLALLNDINDAEQARDAYTSVTEIFKYYCHHVYAIPLGLTDEEVLQALMILPSVSASDLEIAQKILSDSDIIKFGQGVAVSDYVYDTISLMAALLEKKITSEKKKKPAS